MRLRRVVAVMRPCSLASSERSTTLTWSIAHAARSPTISFRAERTLSGTATVLPRNTRTRIEYPVDSERAVALAQKHILPALALGATYRALAALALAALLAGCAAVPRADVAAHPGRTVAAVAERLVGTPYRFGGADRRGFDCSGLAVYAYG